MKSTDSTNLIGTVIASGAASGYVSTIPTDQATAGNGTISLTLGSPPECAISVEAGGKRPLMKDVNGVYRLLSAAIQSVQSWGILPFSSDFAADIGGYPDGAICSDGSGLLWVSTADDNTTTPGATDATWTNIFSGYVAQYTDDETYDVSKIGINKSTGDLVAYADGTWQSYQPAGDYATNSEVLAYLLAGTGLGKSQANPGYQILPGGTIIQYGSSTSGESGGTTITFPIAFPNACISVNLTESNASSTWPGDGSSGTPTLHGVSNGASTQSFGAYSMRWQNSNWGGSQGLGFMWVAVGY